MPRTSLQLVVKLSKLCNLRCSYCYEFNELANKEKIALSDLGRMFENIKEYAIANKLESVNLIWHGGEPFLVKKTYYMAIGELQAATFGQDLNYANSVQTNLTVVSDEILEFLETRSFFKSVGVSFDVHGDQRVDTRGRLRTDTVVDNMQRLLDHRVPFGAITVLSRSTLEYVVDTYRFFDALRVDCRLLPFYRSANISQIEVHALSGGEIVTALKNVFDAWLVSENATSVDPLDDYIDYAIAFLQSKPRTPYDKQSDEEVLIVNTNGDTWGVSETYDPAYQYGNILREPLDAIMNSPGRQRAIEEANARMTTHCAGCPYFGYCPGLFVADATPEQRRVIHDAGCTARELISHIVSRLEQTGLADAIAAASIQRTVHNDALAIAL